MARVSVPSLKGKLKAGGKVPNKPKPPRSKPKPPSKKPAAPAAPALDDDAIQRFLNDTKQMHEDIKDNMPLNPNQLALHRASFRSLPESAQAIVLNDPIVGPMVPGTLGANSIDDIADVITQPDTGISKGTENKVKTVERGEQMPASTEDVDALNLRINKMVSEGAIPDKPTAKKLFKKLGQQGFDVQENMKKLGDKTTPWSPEDITPVGLADAANPASGNWLDTVDEISNQEPKQVGFKNREARTAEMQEQGFEDFRGSLQSQPRLERRVEVGSESKGQIPDSPYMRRQKTVQRSTGVMQKPAADTRIIDEATAADAGLAYNAAGGGDKGLSGGRGPTTPATVGGLQDLLVEQPQGMGTARGMPTGNSLFADPKTALWKNTDEMAREIVRNSGAYSPGSASEAMAIESIQRAAETHFGPHPELDPAPNFVPDPDALKLPGAADLLDDAEFIAEVSPPEAAPAAGVPAMSGNPAAAATPAPAAATPAPAAATPAPANRMPKPPPPTSVRKAQANAIGKKGPKPPPPTTPGGTPQVKTNKVKTAPGVPNPTQKRLTPRQLKAIQTKNAAKKAAIPTKKAPAPKPAPGKAASGVPQQKGTTPNTKAAQPAATTKQAPPPKAAPKTKPKGSSKPKAKTATTKQAPPPQAAPKVKGKKGKGKKQSGYVDDDPTGTKQFDALEEANRKTDDIRAFRDKRNKIVAGTALAGIAGAGVNEALKPGPAPEMNTADLPGSEAGKVQRGGPSDGRPEFDEAKANRDAMDAAEVLQRLRRQRQESAVGSGNRPMYQVPGNMIGRLKGRI